MLIDFKFKNFISFKNQCSLSMSAKADSSHEEHIIVDEKENILKAKVFFGANASGKTALVKAFGAFKDFVKYNTRLSSTSGIPTRPFKFVSNYKEKPTTCEILFKYNGVKYLYSYSRTTFKVLEEELKVYKTSKPTTLFKKQTDGTYYFSESTKKLKDIESKTTENKLFLTTADVWNYQKVKDVVDYFLNNLVVVYDVESLSREYLKQIYNSEEFDEYKKFVLKFFENCDISICDFNVNVDDRPPSKNLTQLATYTKDLFKYNGEEIDKIINEPVYRISTTHKILTENNKDEMFSLDIFEESLGTQSLFKFAPILFDVLKHGKVLVVDELDKSLHPKLVKEIVRMFLSKEDNKNNAQLICNTHEMSLLNLDFLRRDEIMFVERDYKTGISEIYSLADYSTRKDEDVGKNYNLGRYGAIPFISEDF